MSPNAERAVATSAHCSDRRTLAAICSTLPVKGTHLYARSSRYVPCGIRNCRLRRHAIEVYSLRHRRPTTPRRANASQQDVWGRLDVVHRFRGPLVQPRVLSCGPTVHRVAAGGHSVCLWRATRRLETPRRADCVGAPRRRLSPARCLSREASCHTGSKRQLVPPVYDGGRGRLRGANSRVHRTGTFATSASMCYVTT